MFQSRLIGSIRKLPLLSQGLRHKRVTGSTTPCRTFSTAIIRPSTTDSASGLVASDSTYESSPNFSFKRFSADAEKILMSPTDPEDVEVRPDGIPYLPVAQFRAVLNQAFGPGGWGLKPCEDLKKEGSFVVREYELWVGGRLVSTARGESGNTGTGSGISAAAESCKSDALKRCCKDIGIGIDLAKPSWIRQFKKQHCVEVWVQNSGASGPKTKTWWRRKDAPPVYSYPWKEKTVERAGGQASSSSTSPVPSRPTSGFLRKA